MVIPVGATIGRPPEIMINPTGEIKKAHTESKNPLFFIIKFYCRIGVNR